MPRIGVLWPNPPATFDWFRRGLSDLGYTEGRNVNFEYRWAEGRLGQLPELAAELVRLKVDIIVALAPPAAQAARNATQTIPIVFVAIGDPVASGFVANFARPGGNLTGTTRMTSEISVKHLELLKEAVPATSQLAILWNSANSSHAPALKALETPARSLRVKLRLVEVKSADDLDGVFSSLARDRPDGVVFRGPDILHPPSADGGSPRGESVAWNYAFHRVPEARGPHGLSAEPIRRVPTRRNSCR